MSNSEKAYVVVVGTDYSKASDLAVQQAFELAAARPRAEVHVVNVVRLYGVQALVDGPGEPSGFSTLSMADAKAQVERYTGQQWGKFVAQRGGATEHGLGRAIAHLRLEAPAEEIAQIAADLEADLVVVGTHGRSGIARWLLGSVAEAVVRMAPCPVFVVRPKALQEEGPRIEPACPRCLEARRASSGAEYWCEQHRERHGQRHTYTQTDRVGAETEMPLTFHN
jgi:nucleotide-binding universal stress UspA family protein